jgi:subtilisin family serine protease
MKTNNLKWILSTLLLVVAMVPGLASAQVPTVNYNGQERPLYREGQVIVKYKSGVLRTRNLMASLYQRLNVVAVQRLGKNVKDMEGLVFDPRHLTVEQALDDLRRDPSVEYAQPNYMIYAMPIQKGAAKPQKPTKGEPCMIPGLPFPPGCDDAGGGEQPPGGGDGQPCLIPGLPFPPGCDDSGGGEQPGQPGQPNPPGGSDPAIADPPAEVNPPQADPDLAKAYGIAKVGAPDAWKITRGSKNIIVAVIDTGVDYNHPELSSNMWHNPKAKSATGVDSFGDDVTGDVVGYDFFHNDALPFDDHAHGTHCAGVIGAVGGNGKGISGVNQQVSIMAVKFLSKEGSGDTAGAIKSIDYAVSRGAKVLSNSWGGPGDAENDALKESIMRADKAGVLFIAAAGNDGGNNDTKGSYPASFNTPNMIAVAATDANDGLAYFSNRGAKTVHVGAPGVDVYSTTPGNTYQKMSGTSMACPHVAGVAALVWAAHPRETYAQIKARILNNGDTVASLAGKTATGKRVNVLKAIEAK